MAILERMYEGIIDVIPTAAALVITIVIVYTVRAILEKRYVDMPGRRFRSQVVTMLLSFAGLLAVILTLPIGDTRQGQLLSLLGILLSAAIALSSTTFVGNIMAGLMIRALRNFKPGDFIRVGEHFGRVSERGLFHIEIQTEDRDLTTLPNLFLVTNPVKVIRPSGTIISATVSLGYDVSRTRVKELLIQAAHAAQLQDPFVHILKVGDFSITYRIAGLLTDVKQLLTARSHLHEMMIDALHQDGIEIVSPTFMNTRAIDEHKVFIPSRVKPAAEAEVSPKAVPEDLVFDKAEQAESIEKLRERYEQLGKDMDEAKEQLKKTENEQQREALTARINRIQTSRDRLSEVIARREEDKDTDT